MTFRIYGMCRKDARTKVGDYVRLAWECKKSEATVESIRDGIREIGSDFPIAEAVAQLNDKNSYEEWQTDLRYFLFRYEEHLAGAQEGREIRKRALAPYLVGHAIPVD